MNIVQTAFIVALAIIVPLILLPVAFIWFLDIGGIWVLVNRMRARRAGKKVSGKLHTGCPYELTRSD